ncbi:MAG: nitronate monooxygenase family protein [Pseudomonadota bacterium]|nr:nitronate monooxygenase family protein [Pseudomonadota bacterium]
MTIPKSLARGLKIPAIAAPMFLTSGVDLVVETCKAGIIGTFPALNQRTTEGLDDWLTQIRARLGDDATPFGINLIVHHSNPRLEQDLALVARHKVPLVITSLGIRPDVIKAVQAYGGLVFHDVINRRHAEKAAQAGVDGIIAVCAGGGGHAGVLSPFAFLSEIRSFFDGTLVLAGCLSTGRDVAAARMMGADMAYMGTRFIATREAMVSEAQKQMMVQAGAGDVVYTPSISGVSANFLRPSIEAAGMDPDNLPPPGALDMTNEARAWRDVWSAGQGVGTIHDILSTADLGARLVSEYREALTRDTEVIRQVPTV